MEKKLDEEKKKEGKSHHVAWADRIGLNKLWAKDMEAMSMAFGTDEYSTAVWRFYYDLVNIKGDGAKLKDMTDDYIKDVWRPGIATKLELWKRHNPHEAMDPGNVEFELICIEKEMLPELGYFMKQLLEDNGFGFYKSEFDGEYDEM